MYLKERIKNLISEEEGNSLVEFALVLPLLIVLTVGGIYISVSFGQKSILNGVNFMDVRAGSVRANPEIMARKAKELYESKAEGNQKWLEKVHVQPQRLPGRASNDMTDFRVVLAKDGMRIDLLINSLSILSGKKPDYTIRQMFSTMTLPIEYVTHKTDSGSISDHSETFSVVDYETQTSLEKVIKTVLDKYKIPADAADVITSKIFKKLVDSKKVAGIHDSKKADGVLGTNPDLNMDNVKEAYDYWGLDFKYNAAAGNVWKSPEEPIGNFYEPNKLVFLKETAKYAYLIKNGKTALTVIVPELAIFLKTPAVEAVVGPLTAVTDVVENFGDQIGKSAELNNKFIFRKSAIGAP